MHQKTKSLWVFLFLHTHTYNTLCCFNRSKPLVIDFAYKPRETALLLGARQNGCNTVEGIELLIQQGLYQSELWTKLSAPRDLVASAVYEFASKSS